MTERQMTDDRKADDRGQMVMAESTEHGAWGRELVAENRGQKLSGGGQKTEAFEFGIWNFKPKMIGSGFSAAAGRKTASLI